GFRSRRASRGFRVLRWIASDLALVSRCPRRDLAGLGTFGFLRFPLSHVEIEIADDLLNDLAVDGTTAKAKSVQERVVAHDVDRPRNPAGMLEDEGHRFARKEA